jgi:hypothetical protein
MAFRSVVSGSAREAEAIGETRAGGVRLKALAATWRVPCGQRKRFRPAG